MGFSILITITIAIYVPVAGVVALFNAVEWLDHDRFSVHSKQTYARRALMSPLWPLILWNYFKRLVKDAKGADK